MRCDRLAVLLALTLAACGGGDDQAPPAAAPTTAPTEAPTAAEPPAGGDTGSPAVNSLSVDPGDGTVMVGTGPSLYRIAPGAKQAEQVTGTPEHVTAGRKDELIAAVVGGKVLRSRDGGANWQTVATLR